MSPTPSRNAHGVAVSAASDLSGPGALSNVIRYALEEAGDARVIAVDPRPLAGERCRE